MVKTYRIIQTKNAKILKDVYAQEGIDISKELPKVLAESKLKRLEMDKYFETNKESKIPLITHQVYYTHPDNCKTIDGLPLSKSLITTKKLNAVASFKHYIWTNNPQSIPQELKSLAGVEVHSVYELKDFKSFNLVEAIFNQEKIELTDLVTASDVTRVIAMREFGGVYHDLDYEIYNPQDLLPMLKAFNFIAGEESAKEYKFIGHAFFAATPQHPILIKESEILARNLATSTEVIKPDYIKYPYSMFDKLMFSIGPAVISVAFLKEHNQNNNVDILLPHYFLFNSEYIHQNTPESRCHKKNEEPAYLVNSYDGELITTIGADASCGDWHQNREIHKAILY